MHSGHMVAHLNLLLKGFATELAHKRLGYVRVVVGAHVTAQLAGKCKAALAQAAAECLAHVHALVVLL